MSNGGGGALRVQPASLRLIAITDSLWDGVDGLTARAAAAVAGGATMVQLRLRDETARTLAEVARALRREVPQVPLVVNDRADVALAVGAQGVHVGSDGMTASALRRIAPHDFIIGVSIAVEDESVRAVEADYVGIGPVYSTTGQTGGGAAMGAARFAELASCCGIPAVAIGGITPGNVAEVMKAGAAGVAVISALLGAPDPASAARAMRVAQDASER